MFTVFKGSGAQSNITVRSSKMAQTTKYKGSPSGEIVEVTVPTPEPDEWEVLVRVTHSGICGSDLYFVHRDIVLGHEGAGFVEKIGPRVVDFEIGDRVGWGFEHGSCMRCRYCMRGEEQYCPDRKTFGISRLDQGSYATAAIWNQDYLFKIPDNMSNEHAAPMMCAAASVFAPLRWNNVPPTNRVGVLGVGGLGHLAIQFAAKMGCEVVVITRSPNKEDEARRLGATEFHVYSDGGKSPMTLTEPVDHLMVTSSKQPDWNVVCKIMANGGSIHAITITTDELRFPYMPIIDKGLTIHGSLPASRPMLRDMLRFAAVHDVKPLVTTFPMTLEGVRRGFEAMENGKVRYRGILVNE